MKILQVKQTPIAWAPDELSKAINTYSEHSSEVLKGKELDGRDCDILHFHNNFFTCKGKQLIQYHSEPERVMLDYPYDKTVISQYHATLPEYKDCKVVRNVLNFETAEYNLLYNVNTPIKIGYSPSKIADENNWNNKGYEKTKEILTKIQNEFKIEVDIINKVPLDECLKRKQTCDIIIDECITGSFHRSGLEGLALGKLTICHMSPEVEDVLKRVSGSNGSPFFHLHISSLEQGLREILGAGRDYIQAIGRSNRLWMETYWHPKQIVKEFINIYEEL